MIIFTTLFITVGKSVGKSPNMPDWGMTLPKQNLADVIAYLRATFKGQ